MLKELEDLRRPQMAVGIAVFDKQNAISDQAYEPLPGQPRVTPFSTATSVAQSPQAGRQIAPPPPSNWIYKGATRTWSNSSWRKSRPDCFHSEPPAFVAPGGAWACRHRFSRPIVFRVALASNVCRCRAATGESTHGIAFGLDNADRCRFPLAGTGRLRWPVPHGSRLRWPLPHTLADFAGQCHTAHAGRLRWPVPHDARWPTSLASATRRTLAGFAGVCTPK